MILDFILVGTGLVLLILAGDSLVRGAVAMSLKAGISPLIVSLTVVAFGTSAPELIVAVQSALEGASGIALGNVVGSNIANVWLVLGVPAMITPLLQEGRDGVRSYVFMLGATAAFIGLAAFGTFTFWHGLVLLLFLGVFLWDAVRTGSAGDDVDESDAALSNKWIAGFMVAGIIGLPLGAEFLIRGAVGLASDFGMPQEVIGLTIVAIGTSLPELATTVAAALRRQVDVAIGNVVGSNIFNLLAIMGIASLFAPIEVAPGFFKLDFWVMAAASLMLLPFLFWDRPITRVIGGIWLALYAGYMIILI